MNQPPNPQPTPSDWVVLARGDQDDDAIRRCPAGHIHLDYGNFTVRFHKDEFLAFARMVAEAAARARGVLPLVSPATRSSPGFSEN